MGNRQMDGFEITEIGKPAQWLIEAAAEIGLDFSGLTHEKTNEFIAHSLKRHGNEKTERARGQIAVTLDDIALIPGIVKTPDYAIIGIRRKTETFVVYGKVRENNTTIYYEEVLISNKNKALRSKTMFIKMGLVSIDTFMKILSANALTDISGVKIVVGVGGRPDREA